MTWNLDLIAGAQSFFYDLRHFRKIYELLFTEIRILSRTVMLLIERIEGYRREPLLYFYDHEYEFIEETILNKPVHCLKFFEFSTVNQGHAQMINQM